MYVDDFIDVTHINSAIKYVFILFSVYDRIRFYYGNQNNNIVI